MRHLETLPKLRTHLAEDAALVAADALESADNIRVLSAPEPVQIPSLVLWIVVATLEENTSNTLLQADIYAQGLMKALRISERVQARLHHTNAVAIGGIPMFARLEDLRQTQYDSGVVWLSADFRIEVAKSRAA